MKAWDELPAAWKKILLVNEGVRATGDASAIDHFVNPDADQLVWAHNTYTKKKFVMPKAVSEATQIAAFELPFLACYASKIDSLEPVRKLGWVERLNARKNKELASIAPVAALEQLRAISVLMTSVADLKPLAGLAQLETVRVAATKITSLAPLARAPKLRELAAGKTAITDLEPVAHADLESVWIPSTKVTSIEPLRGKTKLTQLILHGSRVTSIGAVETMPALEWIELWSTKVKDFEPLLGLKKLERVGLPKSAPGSVVEELRKKCGYVFQI
jgi:internalin A